MKKYILLLLLACSGQCFSQTMADVNQTATPIREKNYGPLHFKTLTQCIGQKFICLPKPIMLQRFGYSSLRTKKGPLNSVNYQDYVFKLLTLTGFEDDYAVFLNDRNKKMYINFLGDVNYTMLPGVAPVAEIDSARSMYLGKTLWLKTDFLNLYNPDTDEFSKIHATKLSPVKVVEVLAGYLEYQPVMFTLETEDHRRGFIACSLSGTNLTQSLAESCSFNSYFFETDPRLQHK
ncbi:hypothetical protein [Mucilaginibacter sp. CSA2-8R]|uniref:hypothetical protein n=1 Tax=Mucilaginibacter sp. CSA2-8R TaxID=3141542 RepID=UPI00315D9BC7